MIRTAVLLDADVRTDSLVKQPRIPAGWQISQERA